MSEILAKSERKWHDIDIRGKWKLIYKVSNTIGPEAFGGKHLGTYGSPFDGSKVFRRSVDDTRLMGYMVDKLAIDFDPDNNLDHKYIINFLICHPEVNIEGVENVHPKILAAKESNKLTLKCLDYIAEKELDNEDYIDKIIGRLSLDGGKNSIGIDNLRNILAALNMSYRDSRFTGDTEKKALRSKLKTFTRKSFDNAKLVQKAIDNLEGSKDRFRFKEMLKHHVIEDIGGQFKFNNVPLGSSYERVQSFMSDHPEIKSEMILELSKYLD